MSITFYSPLHLFPLRKDLPNVNRLLHAIIAVVVELKKATYFTKFGFCSTSCKERLAVKKA
jgi:hypothetical protein